MRGGATFINALRGAYSTLNDFDLSSDEARGRVLFFLHGMSTQNGWGWAAPPQPPVTPATKGKGKGAVGKGLNTGGARRANDRRGGPSSIARHG